MKISRTHSVRAVTAVVALFASSSAFDLNPATAATPLEITSVTVDTDSANQRGSAWLPDNCDFTVDYSTDPAVPSMQYSVKAEDSDGNANYFGEATNDPIQTTGPGTYRAVIPCAYAPEGYFFRVVRHDTDSQEELEASAPYTDFVTPELASGPEALQVDWFESGFGQTLPAGQSVDVSYSGGHIPAAATVTSRAWTSASCDWRPDDQQDNVSGSAALVQDVPGAMTEVEIPIRQAGRCVWLSVRVAEVGKRSRVMTASYHLLGIQPKSWVTSFGTKKGRAVVGKRVGLTAPSLSRQAKAHEPSFFYCWYLDGERSYCGTNRMNKLYREDRGKRVAVQVIAGFENYTVRKKKIGLGRAR